MFPLLALVKYFPFFIAWISCGHINRNFQTALS